MESEANSGGTWTDQLRQAIEQSGRTQSELARSAGMSSQQLNRFIRGERGLLLDTAEKIAKALDWRPN